MKAKSRKRLLISSVAMLLVAMLALGTATFAWFTVDSDTTASGINVKTDKISRLKVSGLTSGWKNDLEYSNDESASFATDNKLKPASSYDGATWVYTIAGGADGVASTAPGADNFGKFTDRTATNFKGYVFYNMLNVKNFGSDDTPGKVKIEATATLSEEFDDEEASGKYLRVALVPIDGDDDLYTDSADTRSSATFTADDFRSNIYSADDAAATWIAASDISNAGVLTTKHDVSGRRFVPNALRCCY